MTDDVSLLWPSQRRFRPPFAFQTSGIIKWVFVMAFGIALFFLGVNLARIL